MKEIDLEKLSEEALKALAFDEMVAIEMSQNNIKLIQAQLSKLFEQKKNEKN